jgi:protein ImuB
VSSTCLSITGMAVAQAQAAIPDLHFMEADPAGDEGSLREFANWLIHFSPAEPDPPDGIWIDVAGVEHLFEPIQQFERLADDPLGSSSA